MGYMYTIIYSIIIGIEKHGRRDVHELLVQLGVAAVVILVPPSDHLQQNEARK